MEFNLYVNSEIGECSNFISKETGIKETQTVVIAPTKIVGSVEPTVDVKTVTGCSLWLGCNNKNCFYSQAGRLKPKITSPHR